MPLQIDVRDSNAMENCVNNAVDKFGKIDVLFNNAGALWWKNILETPPSKYDLINDINARIVILFYHTCAFPYDTWRTYYYAFSPLMKSKIIKLTKIKLGI